MTDVSLEVMVEVVVVALVVKRSAIKYPGETLSIHNLSAMWLTISTDGVLHL